MKHEYFARSTDLLEQELFKTLMYDHTVSEPIFEENTAPFGPFGAVFCTIESTHKDLEEFLKK